MKTITMQTRRTTYQMGIMEHGFLLHLYYGPRTEGSAENLLSYNDRDFPETRMK